MGTLGNEKCTACRRDSPKVTEAEIQELKSQVLDWTLVEREGIPRLERVFHFENFVEALSFTNRVGALAEAEGHHPAILTEWGSGDRDSVDARDTRPPQERLHHGGKDRYSCARSVNFRQGRSPQPLMSAPQAAGPTTSSEHLDRQVHQLPFSSEVARSRADLLHCFRLRGKKGLIPHGSAPQPTS